MLHVHPVASTSIDVVAYEDEENVLYLRFRDNKVLYAYDDVPVEVVEDLLEAESKGAFVNEEIKPLYTARRIEKLPRSKKAS